MRCDDARRHTAIPTTRRGGGGGTAIDAKLVEFRNMMRWLCSCVLFVSSCSIMRCVTLYMNIYWCEQAIHNTRQLIKIDCIYSIMYICQGVVVGGGAQGFVYLRPNDIWLTKL